MRKLKKLKVDFVSLVDKGANQKQIICKNSDNPGQILKTIAISKTNKVKKMVYGIVYAPDEVDAHGDTADAETIEKASQEFMKSLKLHNIDKQHNLEVQKAYVAENWIVRKGDELFSEVGAWAQGIKIEDEELWKECESGEITGFSLYGTAEVEEVEDESKLEKTIVQKVLKAIGLTKDFNSEMYLKEINSMIWALQDVLYAVSRSDVQPDELKTKVNENVTQFQAAIANLSKAGSIEKSAIEKLQKAVEKLSANYQEQTQEESDMKPEDVQKMIDDALNKNAETLQKSQNDKLTALETKITELTELVTKSNSSPQDPTPEVDSFA